MAYREDIAERFKQGDLARAYDLCLDALRRQPDDLWLRHRAVLCLIRSGALERAERDFSRFRLADARHNEDCLALGARLLKAIAFESSAAEFAARARSSAERYAEVFDQTGGHYPGINAATMALLAGERARSRELARRVLETCREGLPLDPEGAYYRKASEAKAYLLLEQPGAANMALRSAIACDRENYSARATTLRQLRLIVAALDMPDAWLDALEPPRPAHYAGHIFRSGREAGGVAADSEAALKAEIAAVIERENLGPVHGALAAGSDIVIAEAALAAGCPLTVVLPVPVPVFVETSVRPYGPGWVRRCEACLEQAADIVEVTTDRRIMSELSLNHASAIAMGMARMRASVLATNPVQLLVFDGDESGASAGTARDAAVWRQAGLSQCVLPFERRVPVSPLPAAAVSGEEPGFAPAIRAMLFLDIRGSTTVPDDRIPAFVRDVLGRLAGICETMPDSPAYADSWGDGLFLVFGGVAEAARAAVRLQREFAAIDLEALGLPPTLGLRIGGHCGPVHEGADPVQKRTAPFGGQVAIAARIETVTVPGSIFVSEAFAALLSMSKPFDFRCEYVGRTVIDPLMPDMPLYALRAVAPGSPASGGLRGSARSEHASQ